MNNELTTLKVMLGITGNEEDEVLSVYLDLASQKVLNRLYPFGIPFDVDEVPDHLILTKINIASYLYSKRGAEGETSHTENGITRQWGGSDVPDSYFSEVRPFVGVF